jgi:nucleoside-diphosphate-sugar epimerase
LQILITGGSGFVGRNLVEHLAADHRVEAPPAGELDLLDETAVRSYFENRRFDVVIHAAARGVSRRSPGGSALLADNCRMFFNLASHRGRFGTMLFLGSGAIYDRAHWRGGLREEDSYLHVPNDDYGFSKYVCAQAIDGMERVYELRLFGVFGRYEDWRTRFVSNACCRALWGLPIVIERNVSFDYLDVEDVCRAVECCLARDLRYRHYNVCRGERVDLKTLASAIARIAGRGDLPIVVRDPQPGCEYGGNNSRLVGEFPGWRFVGIEESLERLYRWYAARQQSIDPALLE